MKHKAKTKLRNIDDLVEEGLIEKNQADKLRPIEAQYDIGLTEHVRELIEHEDDPIARQYVPHVQELNIQKDEESDPIGDDVYSPVKGVVHRYPDRALLKVTNICAVYCRYCFRKEMIGVDSDHLARSELDLAIDYIASQKDIWEVILTGGDPLVLSPRRLSYIMDALNQIDHIKVIRIHTRVPIANPSVLSDTIWSVFNNISKSIQVVMHVNHASEISRESERVILKMRQSGCSVLSQSVLLRGVNDDALVLEALFKKLVTLHVQPYYLHHLDRAKGTSHFRVTLEKGMQLMKALQGRISGTCLPRYMIDIPGGHGKVPINESYVKALDADLYSIEDYQGCNHLYKEGDC